MRSTYAFAYVPAEIANGMATTAWQLPAVAMQGYPVINSVWTCVQRRALSVWCRLQAAMRDLLAQLAPYIDPGAGESAATHRKRL